MLRYIIIFFVLAVIAGVFGFTGLSADFAAIAKFLTMVFVIILLGCIVAAIVIGDKASKIL